MSADAVLERIAIEQQEDAADTVNNFSTVQRLDRLAPEHRAAAVRRAMRAAGLQADLPDPDTLARAENPPAAQWRHIYIPAPSQDEIERVAVDMVDSVAWRAAEARIRPRAAQLEEATKRATNQAWRAWMAAQRREIVNAEEYEAGQELATKWRPVLDALADMLDDAEERIADLYLAAEPESRLREIAEIRAGIGEALLCDIPDAEQTPAQRRERCWRHHVQQLRDRAKAARQAASALFGTVGRGGDDYADSYSLARWQERQKAAQRWARERFILIDKGGETIRVPLTEVMEMASKAGLSQLYAMHLGLDEHAKDERLAAVFITLTLPPQYHPNPSKGRARWNPRLMPEQADEALNRLWQRFRARLAKRGIRPLGLRVIEPHKDGCPHLHALLYVPPDRVAQVDATLTAMRPEPVPGRRTATKLEVINRERGTPSTYVMKYLIKSRNDGQAARKAAGGESGDGDHLAAHDRVRAWASERGLRRFGWVGLHGFNAIWRAIHKRRELPASAPQAFHEAHAALKARRYKDALAAMGALRDGRTRMRLEYQEVENRYGEIVKKAMAVKLEGETDEEQMMALRQYEARIVSKREEAEEAEYQAWEIEFEQKREELRVTVIVSFPRGPNDDCCESGGVGRTGPPPPFSHGLSREIC